jgi:hypothetical protein
MRTWKRLKCYLWHRRDRFNWHLRDLPKPTPLPHSEYTAYSCNRCAQVWVQPVWGTGPKHRIKHAR